MVGTFLIKAGCGLPRTSQSPQVAVSPAPVCQRNVVLAVVFDGSSEFCVLLQYASCVGRRSSLSKHELEVLAKQIRADLHRIDGDGAGTAPGPSPLKCNSSTNVMMDLDRRHAQEIQQRDKQLAEMRGTLTALNARGSRTGPGRSELLDPKILHKVQPFDGQRTTWRNLRVPMESLPHRTGPEVSRASGENRRPHQRRSKHRPGRREPRTERAVVFRPGPRDAKRKCGRVDSEEREPRRRRHGLETNPGRVRLDRAGKRSRHVVQAGRSPVSSGVRHRRRHQQDGRGHDQVPEDGWRESVRHHQERHPHEGPDKRNRAAEACVPQQYAPRHVCKDATRGDVGLDGRAGSTRADGRRSDGNRCCRQERQEGKGTGTPNPHGDRECFYCHRKGHIKEECRIRITDEKDSKSKDEKDKRKDKRSKRREKKRVNALEGNQGTCRRRSSCHGRCIASPHDFRGQSYARHDDEFQ